MAELRTEPGGERERLTALRSWLAAASAEVNALTAAVAPRCVGAGPVDRIEALVGASGAAISYEQEMRIAAVLHDLSAALTASAQRAALAAGLLDCDRRERQHDDR